MNDLAVVNYGPEMYSVELREIPRATIRDDEVLLEVGPSVTGWNEGDRVVSETAAVIDANNPLSRSGRYNLDPTRLGYGSVIDGAMRRFVPVPQRILHRMP